MSTLPHIPDSPQVIQWLDIGTLQDIPIRGARRVKLQHRTIAVFRTATDEVFAVEDKCPHSGGPLSQGIVHDDCVTCPLHNWVISLRDGCAQGEDSGCTQRFPVRLCNQRLHLGLQLPEEQIDSQGKTTDLHRQRSVVRATGD